MAEIPRIMHRIWIGDRRVPRSAERFWRGFSTSNPGWEFMTCGEPLDPSQFELGRLFASCRNPAELSDLIRYELLWRHGGIYVDTDSESIRGLEPLRRYPAFVGEVGGDIQTCVIGAVPGHPAIRAMIDRLLEYEEIPHDRSQTETAGPVVFDGVIRARSDVTVLPPEYFFPWKWNEKMDRSRITANTFIVQHWDATWVPKAPVTKRIAGAVYGRFPAVERLRDSLR